MVYRKIAPTAVLCSKGRSPFRPRLGSSLHVEEYVMCSIFASNLDSWKMKETNFVDAYCPVHPVRTRTLEPGPPNPHPRTRTLEPGPSNPHP